MKEPKYPSLVGLRGVEYSKAWNKINAEKCQEAYRRYRQNNPEKCKEREKKWKLKNPEKCQQALKKWRMENPERRKALRSTDNAKYYSGWESARMRLERWGVVEDCLIMDKKHTDKELSEITGRSIRAIQIRRCRITKQNNND